MLQEKNIRTLNDLIDAAARRRPSHPAIVTLETRLNYDDLRLLIVRTAAGLYAAGVRRGDCVALLHRNGVPFVTTYFAAVRIGAVIVPINFMVQKADDLAFMLNDCRAVAAVTQTEFLPGLRAAAARVLSLKRIWVSDMAGHGHGHHPHFPSQRPFTDLLATSAHHLPRHPACENDTAAVLYTSGTTGTPKGVMLSHRNLITNATAAAAHIHLRQTDVALCILPMFHTFAWTANVLSPLRAGATIAVAPSVTPDRIWLRLMARHGVTIFTAIPQIFALLAKEATGVNRVLLRWWFFRKVRLAISGAAPLPLKIQQQFESILDIPIFEGYGLTETSPVATLNPAHRRKPGTTGTPPHGVRVKIIDAQGRDAPLGEDGEICIQGDCVMQGYYNRPEETRQAFTADGWLKTGDVGCLDTEGYLSIKDRKKDMIIVKGLKVFSAQVEAVLLEHPAVAEAAVIGVPDATGDETVKAFALLRGGAVADRAELLRHCRQRLDAYKRPRDIEIVDHMPKNTLQKVLKNVLRRRELEKRGLTT